MEAQISSILYFGKAVMQIKNDLSLFTQDLYSNFVQREQHQEQCEYYNKIFDDINDINTDLGQLMRSQDRFSQEVTLNEDYSDPKLQQTQQKIEKLLAPQKYCPQISIAAKKIKIAPENDQRLIKCLKALSKKGYENRKIAANLSLTQGQVNKLISYGQDFQKLDIINKRPQQLKRRLMDSKEEIFEKQVCQNFLDAFAYPKKRVSLKKLTFIARKMGKNFDIKKVTQKGVKEMMKKYSIDRQLIVINFDFQEKQQ